MATTVGQMAGRLTRDWATKFPELSIWRSRWLVRRVGPLLQGVHLERATDPTIYSPTSHVHVLARLSPTISLTLARRLDNSHISIRFHDEELAAAAARLREQSPSPLDTVPMLSEVLDALRAAALSYGPAFPAPGINEIEDMVLLAGAAGNGAMVESCLEFAQSMSAGRSPDSLARMGRDRGWLDQLGARARDQEGLLRVIECEVKHHKLTTVNAVEMPVATPTTGTITRPLRRAADGTSHNSRGRNV